MDDNNLTMLNQSQHEWSNQIVRLLYPLIIEGIQSIFNESWKLCESEEEEDKYLMQFQNFLARIPKWNNSIIEDEVERIVKKTNCNYLEDLISCVHIVHLKILTAIRTGKTQKKIEIEIPKVKDFIHQIYIHVSRNLYNRAYIFEKDLPPLTFQRNRAELEDITKNAIMDVIRDSIPVEKLLRAYLDESTDLIRSIREDEEENLKKQVTEEVKKELLEKKENDEDLILNDNKDSLPNLESTKNNIPPKSIENISLLPNNHNDESNSTISFSNESESPEKINTLTFSNNDLARSYDNEDSIITAPKDIPTLEKISNERNEQRKLEELEENEDDDKIKIFNDTSNNSAIIPTETLTDVMEVLA